MQANYVVCNAESMHFSSEHTGLKISQRHNITAGDLLYLSTRILSRHANFVIRKCWMLLSVSVLMRHQNSSITTGQQFRYFLENFLEKYIRVGCEANFYAGWAQVFTETATKRLSRICENQVRVFFFHSIPVGIYMLKVKNRNISVVLVSLLLTLVTFHTLF